MHHDTKLLKVLVRPGYTFGQCQDMGPPKRHSVTLILASYFFLIYGNMNPLKKKYIYIYFFNPRSTPEYVWRFDVGMLLVLGVGDQYV